MYGRALSEDSCVCENVDEVLEVDFRVRRVRQRVERGMRRTDTPQHCVLRRAGGRRRYGNGVTKSHATNSGRGHYRTDT